MSAELLHRFVQESDQAAFAEIVREHLPLVYGAALRQVREAHAAEDVAQQVFVDFARKSPRLVNHPCLAGWFYASTRQAALQWIRTAARRAQRETEAYLMNEDSAADAPWEKIGPVLDEALAELGERERNGVILRFFANQDFRTIGAQLGLTDNAAQKLVARALDHLSAALSRRGITSTAAALGVVLGSATAAPPALLTSSIIAAAPSAAAGTVATFSLSSMFLKTVLLTTTAAAGFGGGVLFQHLTLAPALPVPPPAVVVKADPATAAELARVRQQLLDANRRVALVEEDNTRLLDAVQRYKASTAKAVAASTPAPSPAPETDADVYVIQPNDTAAKIAQAQGLMLADLAAANPDVQWARLRVGQKIRLR